MGSWVMKCGESGIESCLSMKIFENSLIEMIGEDWEATKIDLVLYVEFLPVS